MTTGRTRTWLRPTLLLALVASGPGPAAAQDCVVDGGALGVGLVEHSCFHTQFGPFVDIAATVGAEPTPDTPNVDRVHTYFRVAIPRGLESVVTYRPVRDGTWLLFADHEVDQRVFDAEGDELEPLDVQDVPGCEGLDVARAFAFTAFVRYRIVLGPGDLDSTFVELEKVSDFETEYGEDVDGDGFGSASASVVTACVPGEGYVPNTRDCDDTDAGVHPGAPERCDATDWNCNGVVDDGFDVGAECSAGVGGCATNGVLRCAADGLGAVCDAVATDPGVERCNGIDDDCDGAVDGAAAVCLDPSVGTACVPIGASAECGCLDDADCASGSCDLDAHACVAAVVSEPGCGCRVVRSSSSWSLLPGLAACGLWLVRRRQRRRRSARAEREVGSSS